MLINTTSALVVIGNNIDYYYEMFYYVAKQLASYSYTINVATMINGHIELI